MSDSSDAFRTLSIFDQETVPIEHGALQWVPVRRELGVEAFGINAYRAARAGDTVIEDHVESPGQEEIYLVVRGAMRMTVGEDSIDVAAGNTVFLPDAEQRRRAEATEDDTVVLAVGGWRDRAYKSLPWEPIYLAMSQIEAGEWAAAAETLEREAGEHRNNAHVEYRLACCYARLGEEAAALDELNRALERRPELRDRAATDEHLESLRGHERWPL